MLTDKYKNTSVIILFLNYPLYYRRISNEMDQDSYRYNSIVNDIINPQYYKDREVKHISNEFKTSTKNSIFPQFYDTNMNKLSRHNEVINFRENVSKSLINDEKHLNLPLLDTYTDKNIRVVTDDLVFQKINDDTTCDEMIHNDNELYISPVVNTQRKALYPEIPFVEMKNPIRQKEYFNAKLDNMLANPFIESYEITTDSSHASYDTNGTVNLNTRVPIVYNKQSPHYKESFTTEEQAINTYIDALKARAISVCYYLQSHSAYKSWRNNWTFLEENLKKSNMLFERLDESDADIAYVINKGEEIKFRIKDEKRFVPINIYQYVLYHEMAHMSTRELQHTKKFYELLNIITLAGFELGYIDLRRIKINFYTTNNQPIICRAGMKEEIILGCDFLSKFNPDLVDYYNDLKVFVSGF